jgi:hypothetical protein
VRLLRHAWRRRLVKEYDIFIPLFYNNGTPVEPVKFQDLQFRLLERFEGLTYFPQANQGFWKFGDVTFRDQIVIYRVISQDSVASRAFLGNLKEQLKREFQQQEILIVEREVGLL